VSVALYVLWSRQRFNTER